MITARVPVARLSAALAYGFSRAAELPGNIGGERPGGVSQVRGQLPAALQARVHVVECECDQNEIKWVIGQCDFFIGSRMHACIVALSQGIPAIGVAYSKKFRSVFETVGAQDWVIDGRDLDAPAAVSRAMELYAKRESTRAALRAQVAEAQARLRDVFRQLLGPGEPMVATGDGAGPASQPVAFLR